MNEWYERYEAPVPSEEQPKPWFQFSIRLPLVLTLLIGIVCCLRADLPTALGVTSQLLILYLSIELVYKLRS